MIGSVWSEVWFGSVVRKRDSEAWRSALQIDAYKNRVVVCQLG